MDYIVIWISDTCMTNHEIQLSFNSISILLGGWLVMVHHTPKVLVVGWY